MTAPASIPRQDSSEARGDGEDRTVLGRGRSGIVYRVRRGDGGWAAHKVFDSHSVTKAVQWLFLGSPNPYVWNEDAIRCALLRRQILAELVPYWLGDGVGVAAACDLAWNTEERSFELHTELSPGRPLALHHPLRTDGDDRLRELLEEVLAPLQERLIEAGFDGLVWQAGKGNPVALNNWLYEETDEGGVWRWIDLESGVPALAPLDPRALFGFYLPRSWAHRRPLFDDVATARLRSYLERHAVGLMSRLGERRLSGLRAKADELEERQAGWKGLSRVERSIGYRLARGVVTAEQAAWYRQRPLRWYGRETGRALKSAGRVARGLARRAVGWLAGADVARLAADTGRFLTSQRFRAGVARRHLAGRIAAWRGRGQLDRDAANVLTEHLDSEESGSYLTDFGVHLAIKPFVKSVEYWLFPALYALGFIGEATLAIVVLGGGAAARTAYTGGRLLQSLLRGRERPWLALVVGTLPIVGNLAYPLQLLYSTTEEEDHLARFILYDGCARLGEHAPIWGGRDTLTEHRLNRLPGLLPRFRR